MQRLLTLFFIIFTSLANGQSLLTVRDVYDFNVGDVFEYNSREFFVNDGAGTRKTILARRDSKNLDSIIYKVKIDEYSCILKNKQRYFTNSSIIVDECYTSLDSCICNSYKHEDLLYYSDTVYFHQFWKVTVTGFGGMFDVCNCFYNVYGKGIGLVSFQSGFVPQYVALMYYKKGNVEFGKHDVNFEQKSTPIPSAQVFYPNPVVSTLYFWEPLQPNSSIVIVDCTGKEIIKIVKADLISEIDMSYVAKGLYYLVVNYNGHKSVYKILKQ
ncbi:MAG: T9SS type A sorting domain-containing protein [Bacteroidia bacterium]